MQAVNVALTDHDSYGYEPDTAGLGLNGGNPEELGMLAIEGEYLARSH